MKWKSLMFFLLMMMNSVSAGLQVLYFECGLLVFRYIHSNGRYGSADLKKGDEVGEQRHARGDITRK